MWPFARWWKTIIARRAARRRLAATPRRWRAHLAGAPVSQTVGRTPRPGEPVILIVAHELAAAGAPKALVEVVIACRSVGWAPVVVSPDYGPIAPLLVGQGALVIVSPDALEDTSPAVALAAEAAAILCNTVVTVQVVRHLPAAKVAWYLLETGAIATYRKRNPDIPALIARVADVWACSPLVADAVRPMRAKAFVIPCTSAPVPSRVDVSHDGEGPVTAVVMGTIESRKGQDLLVEAVRRLPDRHAARLSVSIHGRVFKRSFADRLARQVAGTPSVTIGEPLSPSDSVNAIAGSDMTIVCSRDEPLSIVAVEALSAGRIVVTSRAAGVAAYMEDGVNGFIAPQADAESFAAVLTRALDRQGDWPRIAEEARALYRRSFTVEQFRHAALERLRRIVEARPEASP